MQNVVTKGWGWELWVENNELYCGKHMCVLPGKKCSVHYHKNKKETFYVLKGSLNITLLPRAFYEKGHDIDNEEWWWKHRQNMILFPGQKLTIDTYVPHQFTAGSHEPCEFIEFSTHHDDEDSYRIIKGD